MMKLVTTNEAVKALNKDTTTNQSIALDISLRVPDKDIGRNRQGRAIPEPLCCEV